MKTLKKLYIAYDIAFNTQVIQWWKFHWITLKCISYISILFPIFSKKVDTYLYTQKRKRYIIKNKVAIFSLYNNNDSLWKSSQYFEYYLQHYLDGTDNKKLFVDIGSNIWFYTLLALHKKWFDRAICFEANPETFQLMRKNIELNNLNEKVDLCNFGLWDTTSKISFLQNKTHTWWSKFIGNDVSKKYEWNNYKIIDVAVKKFDDTIKEKEINVRNIWFIKIDVEWFEYNVLWWMKESLSQLLLWTKLFIEIRERHPKIKETREFIINNWFTLKEKIWSNYLYIKDK